MERKWACLCCNIWAKRHPTTLPFSILKNATKLPGTLWMPEYWKVQTVTGWTQSIVLESKREEWDDVAVTSKISNTRNLQEIEERLEDLSLRQTSELSIRLTKSLGTIFYGMVQSRRRRKERERCLAFINSKLRPRKNETIKREKLFHLFQHKFFYKKTFHKILQIFLQGPS